MKLRHVPQAGFTLIEIMTVVGLIGLLAAIAIPNFVKARTSSQTNACINNLRQIQAAIQQCAMETGKGPLSAVTEADVTPYMKKTPLCPAGGTTFADSYLLTDVATDPVCQKVPLTHLLTP